MPAEAWRLALATGVVVLQPHFAFTAFGRKSRVNTFLESHPGVRQESADMALLKRGLAASRFARAFAQIIGSTTDNKQIAEWAETSIPSAADAVLVRDRSAQRHIILDGDRGGESRYCCDSCICGFRSVLIKHRRRRY